MELNIDPYDERRAIARALPFGTGPIDQRSLAAAAFCTVAFAALAVVSLEISRFEGILATIWLPNAAMVILLLRTRFSNEMIVFAGMFAGSVLGNTLTGFPPQKTVLYSVGNIAECMLIVGLIRHYCGLRPDMNRLDHLSKFILAGGLLGPIVAAAIASNAMGPDFAAGLDGAIAWFLTDSMCMILIVPTALLMLDAFERREWPPRLAIAEGTVLVAFGLICSALVFYQTALPLLFLIPPITMLHAFRLGSLGTALFVGLLTMLTMAMTSRGYGPLFVAAESSKMEVHLIQAFVTANFLTGLPVAAILAGRERMVEELAEGKRELALLADNTSDAMMYFDLSGRCTYASPSVEDVLAEPVETFLGSKPTDRMHPDAAERIALAQQRLLSGESEKERFTYRRFHDDEDGTPVYIEAECAIASNTDTGAREGIVVSARDVTERVELELLLIRARRHAENAAQAKSEFLANMSHEIRTPMNGVLGFAELMLRTELDEDQRRHTELIVESGRSMMLLLNDILDLSKIEAGQITIDRQPVNLDSTVEDCAALYRPKAEQKGLTLEFKGEDEPPWAMTDGLRLRQIALNLIGNAVKFTEFGHIMVSYETSEDHFTVRVADTGIGISRDRAERIFNAFTQGESDTARRFGGTGLGLSISRQLAELLGGTIEVESEPGVGSCFTLTLPLTRTESVALPETTSDMPMPRALPRGSRILLAEDHDINRHLVSEMLERCGQSVEIAHDGNEAIAMVFDSQMRGTPYDLVLMDVQMPGCDGYAATRAIRAEGIDGNTLPIVALTANAFPEDIAAARDAGMQAHLPKPLELKNLARTLQRWLPTRIVDRDCEDPPEMDDAASHGPLEEGELLEFPSGRSATNHSPKLVARWEERRSETIAAINVALESGSFSSGDCDELAQRVHKLAGTAAMFGEERLGKVAAVFEHALRNGSDRDTRIRLARQLLELADRRSGPPRPLAQSERRTP